MENLKMKKHELGAWLSLRGFPLGAKRSSTHLYTLQKKSLQWDCLQTQSEKPHTTCKINKETR